jgi:pimeloyl-ACP methyl ester carboxylesterase
VPRVLLMLLVAFFAACGGSDVGEEGVEDTTTEELLFGCIEPGAAEPVTLETAAGEVDGAVFGAGTVGVVLGHERAGSLCNWAGPAQRLAADGFRVLAFDFKSHSTLVEDMRTAAGVLRDAGVTKVVFGGASLGGTVAFAAAAAEPDVAGAFSLSAPAVFGDVDAQAAVRGLEVPLLFVSARDDSHFAADAQLLHRDAASSDKELLIVPGSEHGTQLFAGASAERVRSALADFLHRAS